MVNKLLNAVGVSLIVFGLAYGKYGAKEAHITAGIGRQHYLDFYTTQRWARVCYWSTNISSTGFVYTCIWKEVKIW